MKKLLSLLLALLMVFALAACGNTEPAEEDPADQQEAADLDYVKEKGKITVGYTIYEPMNYTDENGEFTGFDTELAKAVFEQLSLTPEFVEINWDTKELALASKEIDCVWNGMTVTPERAEAMELTNPYLKNSQVLLVKSDMEYTDTSSLLGKVVTAEMGSAGQEAIEADANLSQVEFVGKTAQTECLVEVKAGTAAGAVLDKTLALAMTGEGTDYADLVVVQELTPETYAVAFRKGSNIAAEVNKVFDTMLADGSLAALAEKYGLELAD